MSDHRVIIAMLNFAVMSGFVFWEVTQFIMWRRNHRKPMTINMNSDDPVLVEISMRLLMEHGGGTLNIKRSGHAMPEPRRAEFGQN